MVKCDFAVTKGKFLGHVVNAKRGISADPDKIAAVVGMRQRPSTVADLRTLIGATSYLRKFIPDYADVTKPLRDIQRYYPYKNSVIKDGHWSMECEAAFNALKAALVTAPVLAFPDFNKSFILLCDASKSQLGASLCQLDDDGNERPIAYASRTLTDAEKNYAITDKEGAAVCYAIRNDQFRPFLLHSKVLVVTDHSSLCQLLTKPHLRSQRQERYALDLMELDIEIVHRPGALNELADMLSRAKI